MTLIRRICCWFGYCDCEKPKPVKVSHDCEKSGHVYGNWKLSRSGLYQSRHCTICNFEEIY